MERFGLREVRFDTLLEHRSVSRYEQIDHILQRKVFMDHLECVRRGLVE